MFRVKWVIDDYENEYYKDFKDVDEALNFAEEEHNFGCWLVEVHDEAENLIYSAEN